MDNINNRIALNYSKLASGKSTKGEAWEVHNFDRKNEIFTLIVGGETEEFIIDEISSMIFKALSLGVLITVSQLGIEESGDLD